MSKSRRVDSTEPWFRNPWVWLVIAIPALTMVGSIVTLYLVLTHPHILVNDDAPEPAAASGNLDHGNE